MTGAKANTNGTRQHVLKSERPYFELIKSGARQFDIRKDDQGYAVGDLLILREGDYGDRGDWYYTGAQLHAVISYVQRSDDDQPGLKPGYVVIGISPQKVTPRTGRWTPIR